MQVDFVPWRNSVGFAVLGDRQELLVESIGSSQPTTGRLPCRERPEGREVLGAARCAGWARRGRRPRGAIAPVPKKGGVLVESRVE